MQRLPSAYTSASSRFRFWEAANPKHMVSDVPIIISAIICRLIADLFKSRTEWVNSVDLIYVGFAFVQARDLL
jgi:hypothetical protein